MGSRRSAAGAALVALLLVGCGVGGGASDAERAEAEQTKQAADDLMRTLLPALARHLDVSVSAGRGEFAACITAAQYSARSEIYGGPFEGEPGVAQDTRSIAAVLEEAGLTVRAAPDPTDVTASDDDLTVTVSGPGARPDSAGGIQDGLRVLTVTSECLGVGADDPVVDDVAPEDYGDVIPRGRLFTPGE